jgi:transcriptional regulator with XRE-family HTH domain
MTITERVFALAKQQKKTQGDIAAALNVRQATVSAWKYKSTIPSSEVIAPLAEFLGVSCDYLCTGKEFTAPTSTVNQGIFGDRNQYNTVSIRGDGTVEISEFDGELIKICGRLDMRRKNALLTYAYDLEKQMSDDN